MSTAVIGAGAAGLMAAGTALSRGLDVILIEKNNKPGRKLLITGKGRCNLTNDTDIDGLVAGMPGNGSFLYSTFNRFSAGDIISFFESRGVPLKTERGGRVFPVSDSSKDITDALVSYASGSNLHRCYFSKAAGIKTLDGRVEAVVLENGENICCTSAILATGGYTYPSTGSTGDGYSIADGCGHTIKRPKPSLV
ncbi:MAG: aminoacetone oxidase family FAD-binding enzyme, partial [Eubacteriales bacterium]|nr:aminoacetone oxidase family FAD-binding enzyme [Eubacteriales bacterium]